MNLPNFITYAINNENTSLGSNKAFFNKCVEIPNILINERYNQVIDGVNKYFGTIPNIDDAFSMLSKLIKHTMELEKPLRNQLEKLCESIVVSTLSVPQETIILDCNLVDKINPGFPLRIMPEYSDYEYSFDDANINQDDEILKRRLVNSLIQGVSYLLMMATYDNYKLKEYNEELSELYGKIIALNDFLLFNKEEVISENNPMIGAYVETLLGNEENKTIIESQGLIYPLLLQETYRGFFEMFAANGLPESASDSMYIIKKADITIAEAWDLRIGVPIWQKIEKHIPNDVESGMYPYIFTSIVSNNTDDFNSLIYELITNSTEMNDWMSYIIQQIKHDKEYNLFKRDLERFNLEKTLITDEIEVDNC